MSAADVALRTSFWRESAESLQARLKAALDRFAEAAKNARAWKSSYVEMVALDTLVVEVKAMGFSEADALRWARTRKRKP